VLSRCTSWHRQHRAERISAGAKCHLLASFVTLIPGQPRVAVLQGAGEEVRRGVAAGDLTGHVTHHPLAQVQVVRDKPAGSRQQPRSQQQLALMAATRCRHLPVQGWHGHQQVRRVLPVPAPGTTGGRASTRLAVQPRCCTQAGLTAPPEVKLAGAALKLQAITGSMTALPQWRRCHIQQPHSTSAACSSRTSTRAQGPRQHPPPLQQQQQRWRLQLLHAEPCCPACRSTDGPAAAGKQTPAALRPLPGAALLRWLILRLFIPICLLPLLHFLPVHCHCHCWQQPQVVRLGSQACPGVQHRCLLTAVALRPHPLPLLQCDLQAAVPTPPAAQTQETRRPATTSSSSSSTARIAAALTAAAGTALPSSRPLQAAWRRSAVRLSLTPASAGWQQHTNMAAINTPGGCCGGAAAAATSWQH